MLCITSCLVSCHSDLPTPVPEKLLLMAAQWGCGCAGKIMVRSYYIIYMYTVTDLDLFIFNLYLCSSVDLGGFIQVYVRPESKPLLCQ